MQCEASTSYDVKFSDSNEQFHICISSDGNFCIHPESIDSSENYIIKHSTPSMCRHFVWFEEVQKQKKQKNVHLVNFCKYAMFPA